MKKEKEMNHKDRTMVLNLSLLLVFLGLMLFGIYLVRDKLLYNADEMGTYLAEGYSREEESRISIYRMFLNLGALYVNASIEENASEEEIQAYLERYSKFFRWFCRRRFWIPTQ